MRNENILLQENSGVCIIRFKYSAKKVALLNKIIMPLIRNELISDQLLEQYYVLYLYYKEKYTISINNVYAQCIEQHEFIEAARFFDKDSITGFYKRFIKHIIFEVECGNKTDVVDLRFLYMKALHFDSIDDISIHFRIYEERDEIIGYKPLELSFYHQMRTFYLLSLVNDKMLVLAGNNEKMHWARLYAENEISKRLMIENEKESGKIRGRSAFSNIGRIFPLINISLESYRIMQESACSNINDDLGLHSLLVKYKNIVEKEFGKETDLLNSDNFLEALLYYAMCAYVKIDNKDYNEKYDLIQIHEHCMDCAQGILQAVENAFLHAVINSKNKDQGCGTLVLRIRKREDAHYYKGEKAHCFFIEIYVTDLLYDETSYLGIVNKFILNAQNRFQTLTDEEKHEWMKHCGNPGEWNTGKDNRIELEDMFLGGEENSVYRKYLLLPKVIAYHYGLQIFNNTIAANEGYLSVWSKEFYSSNIRDLYEEQRIEDWTGTAYTVYIPLDIENQINYEDTIDDNNKYGIENMNEYSFQPLFACYEEVLKQYIANDATLLRGKDYFVKLLNEKANGQVECNGDKIIYYIDCINIPDVSAYEILAKSVFMLMATGDKYLNVAIINLKNKYEVIKLFRQFALFYDRQGKNEFMKEKNVYLVDRNAEIDVAFGGRIDDIITNMQTQLIWGGVGETIKRIVYHLGGRKHNE